MLVLGDRFHTLNDAKFKFIIGSNELRQREMDILFFSLPHEPTTVISSCCHDLSSGGSWFCLEFLGSNVQGIEMGFLNTVAFFFFFLGHTCALYLFILIVENLRGNSILSFLVFVYYEAHFFLAFVMAL